MENQNKNNDLELYNALKAFLRQEHISWNGEFLDYAPGCNLPRICVYYAYENEPCEVFLDVDTCTFKFYTQYCVDELGDEPDQITLLQDLSLEWAKFQLERNMCTPQEMQSCIAAKQRTISSTSSRAIDEHKQAIEQLEIRTKKDLDAWSNLDKYAETLQQKERK